MREKPKIRVEEMWMMKREWTHHFQGLQEYRAKIMRLGKIEGACEDGVQFHFINSPEEYFLQTQEFIEKFEKVY